jgi:hypothetical protein
MKNHFLSRFDADNLRKTIIYFGIALPLIIISLAFGIGKNDWAAVLILFGFAFFFYAVLRPWANAKYYGIMCIILIIIITLFLGVVLKKLNSNFEKEIGESIVMVCIVGVIVGIIGIFRFRKSD